MRNSPRGPEILIAAGFYNSRELRDEKFSAVPRFSSPQYDFTIQES